MYYMEDVLITPGDVANSIHAISDKLSRSLDNVPAYFLKKVLAPLFNVLSHLCMLLCFMALYPPSGSRLLLSPYTKKDPEISPTIIAQSHSCVSCARF